VGLHACYCPPWMISVRVDYKYQVMSSFVVETEKQITCSPLKLDP